jgi:hypothetical protein
MLTRPLQSLRVHRGRACTMRCFVIHQMLLSRSHFISMWKLFGHDALSVPLGCTFATGPCLWCRAAHSAASASSVSPNALRAAARAWAGSWQQLQREPIAGC